MAEFDVWYVFGVKCVINSLAGLTDRLKAPNARVTIEAVCPSPLARASRLEPSVSGDTILAYALLALRACVSAGSTILFCALTLDYESKRISWRNSTSSSNSICCRRKSKLQAL